MHSNDNSNNNQHDPSLPKKEAESSQFLQGVNSFENRFNGLDGQMDAPDQNGDLIPNLMQNNLSVQQTANFYPMNQHGQPTDALRVDAFTSNEPHLTMHQGFSSDKNQLKTGIDSLPGINSVEMGYPSEKGGQLQKRADEADLEEFQHLQAVQGGTEFQDEMIQDQMLKSQVRYEQEVPFNPEEIQSQLLKQQPTLDQKKIGKTAKSPKVGAKKAKQSKLNPEEDKINAMEESKFSEEAEDFDNSDNDDSDAELLPPKMNFKMLDKNESIDYEGQNKVILRQLKEEEAPVERIITGKHFYKEMQKLKERGTNAVPPKKHASAYIMFQKEKRPEILKRTPMAKVTEVVKEIAYCWGQMLKTDKQRYKDAAKRDKERYERELKHLHTFSKDLKKPKKCLSAYMIFVQETRPLIVKLNSKMGALQVMKQVGKAWQSMNEAQRQYFKNKADIDKVRYLKQMKEFYDEVERIGNRVGIVRSAEGIYNVQLGNTQPHGKKGAAKDKVVKPPVQTHDMQLQDTFSQINSHLFDNQAAFMGQQQQRCMFDQVNLELGQQNLSALNQDLDLGKQTGYLGKRSSGRNLLDNNMEMFKANQQYFTQQQIQKLSQDFLMAESTPQQVMQQHQQGLKKQLKPDASGKSSVQNTITDQSFYLHDDPDRPGKQDKNAKKPPTAFIVFSQEFRVQVKQQFPSLTQDQCVKVVAKRWQSLSKEQRVPFEKKSVEAKRSLDNGMKYSANSPVNDKLETFQNEALTITDDFLQQISDILAESNPPSASSLAQQGIINNFAASLSAAPRPNERRTRRNSSALVASQQSQSFTSQKTGSKAEKKKPGQPKSKEEKADEGSHQEDCNLPAVNNMNDLQKPMSKRAAKQNQKQPSEVAQSSGKTIGSGDLQSQKSQGQTATQQLQAQQMLLNTSAIQKMSANNQPHSPQGSDIFQSLQNFKGSQQSFLGIGGQNAAQGTSQFLSGLTGQQQEMVFANNQRNNDQSNPKTLQNNSQSGLFPANQSSTNPLFAQNLGGINGLSAGQQFPQQTQPGAQTTSQTQNSNWNPQNFNFTGQIPASGTITPTNNQPALGLNNYNFGTNPLNALVNSGSAPIDYTDINNNQAQVGNMVGFDFQQQLAQAQMSMNYQQMVMMTQMGMAAPMMNQYQQQILNQMQFLAQNPAAAQAQAQAAALLVQHPQLMQRGGTPAPGITPQTQQPVAQQQTKFQTLASNSTPEQGNNTQLAPNARAHSFSFSGNLPGQQNNANQNQSQAQQLNQQQQFPQNNDNSGNNFLANGPFIGATSGQTQQTNAQPAAQNNRAGQVPASGSQAQSNSSNEMKQVSPQFAQFTQQGIPPQNNLKDHDGGTLSQGEVGAHQEVSNAGPSSLYPSSHGQGQTVNNNTYGVSPVHMSSQPPSVLTGGFPDDTNFGLLQHYAASNNSGHNSMSHPQGILPDNIFFQQNNNASEVQNLASSAQSNNQQSRQNGNTSFNTSNLLGGTYQNNVNLQQQQQANAIQMFHQSNPDYQTNQEGKSEAATARLTPSLQAQIPNKSQISQNQAHQPQSPIGVNKDQFISQLGNQMHSSFNPQ